MTQFLESFVSQLVDLFGLLTSGTQAGYEDSAFFWSDMFHYRKTYQFARQLYKNAVMADTTADPERAAKQQAFALGWISHCATDVAAHPFTNAKTGGPYRTHWQRHHVIENHMDALAYALKHPDPTKCYASLDTSALHFRLAFRMDTDPMKPDDAPSWDWFPANWKYPDYLLGTHLADATDRKQAFDVDSEAAAGAPLRAADQDDDRTSTARPARASSSGTGRTAGRRSSRSRTCSRSPSTT